VAFISLSNASFRLGDDLVFENASITFNGDQQWAVVGPNGSGKSLFGDALRGKLPLVQGELRYRFKPPPGLSHEECIGHVSFEDRKANVHDTVVQSRWNSFEEEGALTVREFLSYKRVMDINPFEVSAEHAKAKKAFERHFRRAISLLKIQPFLNRTLLSLSNGETQRVQLARALCLPLRLLILDEPFNGLDAGTRGYFRIVLDDLMRTRLRVFLITARIEEIPARISHLLIVNNCQIVAAGPRDDVLSRAGVRRLFSGGRGKRHARTPMFRKTKKRLKQLNLSDGRTHTSLKQGVNERLKRGTNKRVPGLIKASPQSTDEELVRLHNVTVRYGNATILNGINWTIQAGESWALLGPNGSGKTTLLSLILGDNPQAYMNDVVVFGRRRGGGESIWEIKKSIGWVSPELHVHFEDSTTCLEVVESGFHDSIGLFKPVTARQRAAARRWLKEFQLLEYANEPLFALSAGLQRMVLLARALVKSPRLLILDEPCQGLDDAHRDFFVREVDDLLRTGSVTAIYVTHRPEEIPRSIARVLRLTSRGGKAVIQ
jgi:molybdate transport system ATP-binding protein